MAHVIHCSAMSSMGRMGRRAPPFSPSSHPARGKPLDPARAVFLSEHGPLRKTFLAAPPARRTPALFEDTTLKKDTRPPPARKAREKKHLSAMSLRLPPADLDRIRADAAASGLTVSEVVRRRYFGVAVRARVDHQMISELRRLGGLVKHSSGAGMWTPEARSVLSEIAAAINRIGESAP